MVYLIHNLKHGQQFLQIQTARLRAWQIFAKILCRKRAAIQVVFLRMMVAKATEAVIIIWNTRHQQFFHPSIKKSRVVAIFRSRDSNCKAYNYPNMAGKTHWINISALSGNATLLKEYNFLEWICFPWMKIIPWMNIISLNIISLKLI